MSVSEAWSHNFNCVCVYVCMCVSVSTCVRQTEGERLSVCPQVPIWPGCVFECVWQCVR